MASVTVWLDPALEAEARQELSDEWALRTLQSDSTLSELEVAVVRGAEAATKLAESQVGLSVVGVVDEADLETLDASLADVVCFPWKKGELQARIRLLAKRDVADLHTRLLSRAVRYAGDVIEISDARAVIQYVNPSFTTTLGYDASEIIGKTPAQLQRSDAHTPEYFRNIDQTLSAGKIWSGLLISRHANGDLVHLDSTIAPVANSRGRITHHVAVKRDVTERVKRERAMEETNKALRKARDAALRANQTKSEFLANMSHELRTPLNAVIGYSELLIEDAEEEGNEALVADLRKIHSSGAHLLNLINDVLDMSKIESGKMELDLQDFELAELLDGIKETIEPLAKRHGNEVLLDVDTAPKLVHSDRQKLRQILLNLLSNACKFTENGQIRFSAFDDGNGWVRFRVQDEGIGMSEAQRKRIFRPFVQADSSTTRRYGGTGLGLAISLRFCEMMGGRIEVDSEHGKGSTFEVSLPVSVRSPNLRGRARRRTNNQPSVLVIDDDQLTYDVLNRNFADRGVQVDWVATGAAGLSAARETQPDVIVLDVVMPGLDGWSVLTTLKGDPETEDIPVVMVTLLDEAELGVSMGAVDYLIKPVRAPRLVSAVERWVGRPHDSVSILVVEDDASLRDIAERTLAAAGYRVRSAVNGLEALKSVNDEAPDIIILDLMMPEMDGFQFLHELRANPQLHDTPVIVATAKELTEEEQLILHASAQKVIQKVAHTRAELLERVEIQVGDLLRSSSMRPPMSSHPPGSTRNRG